MKLPSTVDLGLVELRTQSPLTAQLLPSGALFALRHGTTMLNQYLPGPAEDGLFRLLLRWHDAHGVAGWHSLTGPGRHFAAGPASAAWQSTAADGLQCTVTLQLHPTHAAWAWRVQVRNTGALPRRLDVLHAQDLGLADEGAIRNNEAYVSHYIDLLPHRDERLGWTIFARQNQPAAGGRYPWAAFACATGAEAFCTDGWQFFGTDHRLAGTPSAVRSPSLPSRRLQYESALGGLQSRPQIVAPGAAAEFVFLARFLPHHPAASAAGDLAALHELLPLNWLSAPPEAAAAPTPRSLFLTAPWVHGQSPTAAELATWFAGPHRHQEYAPDGTMLSFFCAEDTHVVTRDKEALVARPHGHVLRSGDSSWIDDEQFGLTCYAAGLFSAQVYLGNPSFARLLPVVRNALNLVRSGGQRVFVRRQSGGAGAGAVTAEWRQLGVPSAFAMSPGQVRWLYRLGPEELIEARVWCSPRQSASFLDLRVVQGAPCEFLITHSLVLGVSEFEHAGIVSVHAAEGWCAALPASDSLVGRHKTGTAFALAAAAPEQLAVCGGDELLLPGAPVACGQHVVLRTPALSRCGVILLGTLAGADALPQLVQAARTEYRHHATAALPIAPRLRLTGTTDAGLSRLTDLIPWMNHNASIHFSAPHGLEQYGGAAWGVRDVCQGSIEWLQVIGRHDVARRVLQAVFAQQYIGTKAEAEGVAGGWPQWFMHDPYRFIQQAHSHGDVCFWPVKALCDYVEASNDLAFLDQPVAYLDAQTFTPTGPEETVWAHCARVLAHVQSRYMPGTTLVNYGDGDWDDTLQPADPTMRTRMTSAWTVGLAYHTFRQFAALSRRAGHVDQAVRLEEMLQRMRTDFAERLMPGGIVAGFLLNEKDGSSRPLLHPTDKVTGIRYRLLPMTRSILAELFTPAEAQQHLALIEKELRFPDGVRLMSDPAVYHGGLERLFKRADTAANVGREIGLQYVHAHLRYAEALAKVGDAERLWTALQVVNPVALHEIVPNAAPRQSNVYFSSSDADFADRYEAAARWHELRAGRVPVRGGWRLYSSGPGLFLHKIRSCLLGLRESYGDLVFDPVLPRSLDGLVAQVQLCGRPVDVAYHVRQTGYGPTALLVNGARLEGRRDANPYRTGGLRVPAAAVAALLTDSANRIEIDL